MNRGTLKKKKLPDHPGVYFFKGKRHILYIGRATSLRDRLASYFGNDLIKARGSRIVDMVNKSTKLDFIKTDSVLEAILLEAELIRKYQPKYNTESKDDKSFNSIVITKEEFPQVLVVRDRDLDKENFFFKNKRGKQIKVTNVFGPFAEGSLLLASIKIVRRIFPFRGKNCVPNQIRPCFERQIGVCPGVCTGEIGKSDYASLINKIKLFLSGRRSYLEKKLKKDMKDFAGNQDFEKANEVKKQLFAIKYIRDTSLLKNDLARHPPGDLYRIEAYDIAHISGKSAVAVMTVVLNGFAKKSEYRVFKPRYDYKGDDVGFLKEVLERRFKHNEWPKPQLIVVDGGLGQLNAVHGTLRKLGIKMDFVAVTKDANHKPIKFLSKGKIKAPKRDILLANSEAHRFSLKHHRASRGKSFFA